jgi:hypothetical protein
MAKTRFQCALSDEALEELAIVAGAPDKRQAWLENYLMGLRRTRLGQITAGALARVTPCAKHGKLNCKSMACAPSDPNALVSSVKGMTSETPWSDSVPRAVRPVHGHPLDLEQERNPEFDDLQIYGVGGGDTSTRAVMEDMDLAVTDAGGKVIFGENAATAYREEMGAKTDEELEPGSAPRSPDSTSPFAARPLPTPEVTALAEKTDEELWNQVAQSARVAEDPFGEDDPVIAQLAELADVHIVTEIADDPVLPPGFEASEPECPHPLRNRIGKIGTPGARCNKCNTRW